jgi:cation transporter-like permease
MVSFWSRRLIVPPDPLVVCTSTAVGAMVSVMVTVAMFPLVVPSKAR